MRAWLELLTFKRFIIACLLAFFVFVFLGNQGLGVFTLLLCLFGCFVAYFLLTVKYWQNRQRLPALLLITLPLIALIITAQTIGPEGDSWGFLLLLIGFGTVFAVIPVILAARIKTWIDPYLFKPGLNDAASRSPRVPVTILALFLMTLLMALIGISIHAQNAGTGQVPIQSATGSAEISPTDNDHYLGMIPTVLHGLTRPLATSSPQPAPVTRSTTIPRTVSTPSPLAPDGPYHYLGTGRTDHTFRYYLRGEMGTISFSTYDGAYENISRNLFVMEPGWDRTRNYEGSFDHHVQKVYLQPLVEAIRAKTPVRDDQARIAISLVQNIPYDWGRNKSVLCQGCFMPYATLHTQRGICMDKSILMAYLLRELGYDVALLSFPQENHMAVGIRTAPPYDYRNSGYAFIESTQPALPTYSGWIVLRSTPIVEKVQGRDYQFDSIIEEYNDVRQIELLRNKSNQNPVDLGSILERYRIMSKYG